MHKANRAKEQLALRPNCTTEPAETALVLRDCAFEVPVHAVGVGDRAFLETMRSGAALLACAAAGARAEPGHDPDPLLGLLAQAGAFIAD